MAKSKEKMRDQKRKWRAKYPIKARYYALKSRAKERGHTCGITLEEFTEWCLETGYHLLKGKSATSASIDRKQHHIGYEKGNLQIRTLSDNSKKELARRRGVDYEGEWTPKRK